MKLLCTVVLCSCLLASVVGYADNSKPAAPPTNTPAVTTDAQSSGTTNVFITQTKNINISNYRHERILLFTDSGGYITPDIRMRSHKYLMANQRVIVCVHNETGTIRHYRVTVNGTLYHYTCDVEGQSPVNISLPLPVAPPSASKTTQATTSTPTPTPTPPAAVDFLPTTENPKIEDKWEVAVCDCYDGGQNISIKVECTSDDTIESTTYHLPVEKIYQYQVGIEFINDYLDKVAFSKAPKTPGDQTNYVIANYTKGSDINPMLTLSIYGKPRVLNAPAKTFLDRMPLVIGTRFDKPFQTYTLGIAYEVVPQFDITAGMLFGKSDRLAPGYKIGDPISSSQDIPTVGHQAKVVYFGVIVATDIWKQIFPGSSSSNSQDKSTDNSTSVKTTGNKSISPNSAGQTEK